MEEPKKRKRNPILKGQTPQIKTGCGPLYITMNEDADGLFEVFATMGKAGGCATSQTEAIGRLVTLALRYHVPTQQIVKQLQGISCHSPVGINEDKTLSCADAIAKVIRNYTKGEKIK